MKSYNQRLQLQVIGNYTVTVNAQLQAYSAVLNKLAISMAELKNTHDYRRHMFSDTPIEEPPGPLAPNADNWGWKAPTKTPDVIGTVKGWRLWHVRWILFFEQEHVVVATSTHVQPPTFSAQYDDNITSRIQQEFELWPIGYGYAPKWETGRNRSKCDLHSSPNVDCGCGFWGIWEPWHLPGNPLVTFDTAALASKMWHGSVVGPHLISIENEYVDVATYGSISTSKVLVGTHIVEPQMAIMDMIVMGRIEGWGVVVEGEKGFRAEYARILEICDNGLADCIEAHADRSGLWPSKKPQQIKEYARLAVESTLRKLCWDYQVPLVHYERDRTRTVIQE